MLSSSVLQSCPTIADRGFQTCKHGGMHSKRLESRPGAFSEYNVRVPGVHLVHLAQWPYLWKQQERDSKIKEIHYFHSIFSRLSILPVNFSIFWQCLFKPWSTAPPAWQWEAESQSLMRTCRAPRPSMVTGGRSHSSNPRDPPGLAACG